MRTFTFTDPELAWLRAEIDAVHEAEYGEREPGDPERLICEGLITKLADGGTEVPKVVDSRIGHD